MMFFKACPKCRGDLVLGRDIYGRYVECIQCGFMKDITDMHQQTTSHDSEHVQEWKAA